MPAKLHDIDAEHDELAETTAAGVTRRELFQIGNVLAPPAALRPAVTFVFVGTISGETISGPIYMGEYLNARFTARRHSYPPGRTRIVVPGGPPLAT